LALALDGDSLDGQKVASHFGPGEPGDLADAVHLLRLAVAVLLDPEILLEVAAVDGHLLLVWIEQQLSRDLAADLRDLPLERADAGLSRVVTHDVIQHRLADRDLVLLQAVVPDQIGRASCR